MAGADWEGELARLRERAYGPDADILNDAAARARLDELELRRVVDSSRTADAADTAPAVEDGPSSPGAAGTEAPAAPSPSRPAAGRVWRRRRLALVWIASTVAAVALGAAAATAVIQTSGSHDAVLGTTSAPAVGAAFDPTDVQGIRYYESFAGIHVASGTVAGRPCLTVWTAANATVTASSFHCGTRQFPPSIDLVLDDAAGDIIPAEAIKRFGRGAIIRFALVRDTVTVDIEGR
ncbi:hypothetical protein [Microbacterium deminutum]